MRTKFPGRHGDAPRRAQGVQVSTGVSAGGEAVEMAGFRIKYVNQSMTGPGNVVVFPVVLFGKRHDDQPAQALDIKRRITGRSRRVRELDEVEVGVIDVHGGFREVGQHQQWTIVTANEGDTLVNRAIPRGQQFRGVAEGAAPAGNGTVLAGKNENVAIKTAIAVDELPRGH